MTQISLDQNALTEVVRAAVISMISGPQREALIAQAIAGLLTEKDDQRGYSGRTKIDAILHGAVYQAAQEVARKRLMEPHYAEMIDKVIAEAWAKLMGGEERQKLVDKIADAMSNAFSRDR